MRDNRVRLSNADMAKSIADLGISEEMITQNVDSNYVVECLPLLLFGSLYYAVLTAVHIATGVGAGHIPLAVLTGTISVACFTGRWLIKERIIAQRHIHLLAVILLMGLVGETYFQIWMLESTEPIAEIVIAIMIMGIVLISQWSFILLCVLLLGAFLFMLGLNESFSAYLSQPYVLLLVAVAFLLSSIIFIQRRRGVFRNTKLHLIDHLRNAELADANAAKNQFLSAMSHELRTPLNAIYGFSQLMETDTELADKHKDWVGHILHASEHLMYLISQVLNLSRIESQHVEIERELVVAEELIEYSINMTNNLTAENHVVVKKKIAPGLEQLSCYTDPKAMQQILLNLLSNAIKYNRPGGSVTISLLELDDKRLGIQIADTGLGIPKDKQAAIFEPFNRLGREESSISGTGIGLTITSSLCQALGVELSFESEEGVGSSFRLAIPRK